MGGGDVYFGPINPSTDTGQVIFVNTKNADVLVELRLLEYGNYQATEEELRKLKEIAKKEAGMAYKTNYKVVAYEPDGTSITIKVWNNGDSSTYVPPDERWTKIEFIISKDGKTMKRHYPPLSEDFLKRLDPAWIERIQTMIKNLKSYKFIDLKTAPEDKK